MQEIMDENKEFQKISEDCSDWLDGMDLKLASLIPNDSGLADNTDAEDINNDVVDNDFDNDSIADSESKLSLLMVCVFDIVFFLTLKRLLTCKIY